MKRGYVREFKDMRNIYIRIMLARVKGVGMRLSVEEVQYLGDDWAIREAAYHQALREGRCGGCYKKRCRCEERLNQISKQEPASD